MDDRMLRCCCWCICIINIIITGLLNILVDQIAYGVISVASFLRKEVMLCRIWLLYWGCPYDVLLVSASRTEATAEINNSDEGVGLYVSRAHSEDRRLHRILKTRGVFT